VLSNFHADLQCNVIVICCGYFRPTHHQPFNGLFSGTTWVSRYQKGKTSLDLNKARGDGVLGGSGISWTIYSLHLTSDITTPTSHHSIFSWPDALPDAPGPTNSVKALKAICGYSHPGKILVIAFNLIDIAWQNDST